MEKKLLSTAIVGALAASMSLAANADVTVFGHLDTSMNATDADGGTDDINMDCTTCSVGFKGSEDLGNGLKAIFKLDFQFDMTERNTASSGNADGNNASQIRDRDQWLGMAGNFGKVRFGTISTGYKSTGAMIDPLYRTALQARSRGLQSDMHNGAGENGQGRMENHVRYDSMSMGGFKAIVDYSFDSTDSPTNRDDDAYGLTGLYENGPILGYASYVTNDQGGEDSAWKLGGSYAMGAIKVFGQYEVDDGLISSFGSETPGVTNNIDGADVWHLGGTFTMGNNMLYLAYGQGDERSDNTGGYDSWTLAATHNMSKRTMIYTGYTTTDCDDATGTTVTSLCTNTASGGDVDQFSVGIKHKF
ncbi:MAG: hypothetical protein CMN57_03500 [Gammaproteobacteria bacterium]|nr:hypothetical protein [Gammaproteobacteria bacterium]